MFDHTLSLFNPSFIDVLRRYRRALRARNALLRAGDDRNAGMVDVYEPVLAAAGWEIRTRRGDLCAEFAAVFADLCDRIGGLSDANIEYRPSWREAASADDAAAELRGRRERDLAAGTTTSGPHRDDFRITLGQARFSAQGSTGQKRLASLVLRLPRRSSRAHHRAAPDSVLDASAGNSMPAARAFCAPAVLRSGVLYLRLPTEPYQRYGGAGTINLAVSGGAFTPCTAPATC